MGEIMFEKIKVYFAHPIVGISEKSKHYHACIYTKLAGAFGRENVYDPEKYHVPNEYGMPMNEWGRCVFTHDVEQLQNSDFVVVCNYGRNCSAGTAFEAGLAFGSGKRILVIQMPDVEDDSLMITNCGNNKVLYAAVINMPVEDWYKLWFKNYTDMYKALDPSGYRQN